MRSLLEHPLNDPATVVAETEVVIQGGEAVSLARLLHLVQLGHLKFVIFDDTPVVCRRRTPASQKGSERSKGSYGRQSQRLPVREVGLQVLVTEQG